MIQNPGPQGPIGLTGPGIAAQTSPTLVLNTIYQNTTSKPIFLLVNMAIASLGSGQLLCDATATPSTYVINDANNSAVVLRISVTIIVLPAYYYQVMISGGGSSIISSFAWT